MEHRDDVSQLAKTIAQEAISPIIILTLRKWLKHLLDSQTGIDQLTAVAKCHPNGFLKIPVGNYQGTRTRIHLWRDQVENNRSHIHNHTADYTSFVLIGALEENLYEFDLEGSMSFDRISYPSHDDATGRASSLGRVTIRHVSRVCHGIGDVYSRESKVLHNLWPQTRLAATLVRFHATTTLWTDILMPLAASDFLNNVARPTTAELSDALITIIGHLHE